MSGDSGSTGIGFPEWKTVKTAFKVSRWLGPLWGQHKSKILHEMVKDLHLEIAHSTKDYAFSLTEAGDERHALTQRAGVSLCTKSLNLMSQVLGLSDYDLNCSLKVCTKTTNGDLAIGSLARGEPGDSRPYGDQDIHLVSKNTVWCALMAMDQNEIEWSKKPINCFACNDLPKEKGRFSCDRENWDSIYKSTLVYSLKCLDYRTTEKRLYGFLAFDSPKRDAFKNVPNVFDYCNGEISQYNQLLRESTAFHLGAIIADNLAGMIKPFYEAKNADTQLL